VKKIVSLALLSLITLSVLCLGAFYPCFADEWIVEVISVETGVIKSGAWMPNQYFRKGETISFKVMAINRASVSKDAKITVTLYDRIDQPIGYNDEKVAIPPEMTQTVYIPISIPSWAIDGEAVAYINALQVIEGLPLCPPYCPETSINLTICSCTSKTVIGQGYTADVNVHVTNVYAMEPVMFDLLVYYDDHGEVCNIIGKVDDIILEVGESESFKFIWNTAGVPYGVHYIYVWVYFDYPALEDELLENVTVTVTIPGDVNGDFKVNMQDLYLLILHFGCQNGSPRYIANCDINGDGKIDMKDAFIITSHFGERL